MSLDQTNIGRLTAELMDRLEQEYGEDCSIGDAVLVTEVVGPDGTAVTMQATSNRTHVNLGLLEVGRQALLGGLEHGG
ncbi:MAG: hypothetical protein ACR2K9_05385 [Solirubrobacteraceae bacterium]